MITKALDVKALNDDIPIHVLQHCSSAVVKLLLILLKYCLIHGKFLSN